MCRLYLAFVFLCVPFSFKRYLHLSSTVVLLIMLWFLLYHKMIACYWITGNMTWTVMHVTSNISECHFWCHNKSWCTPPYWLLCVYVCAADQCCSNVMKLQALSWFWSRAVKLPLLRPPQCSWYGAWKCVYVEGAEREREREGEREERSVLLHISFCSSKVTLFLFSHQFMMDVFLRSSVHGQWFIFSIPTSTAVTQWCRCGSSHHGHEGVHCPDSIYIQPRLSKVLWNTEPYFSFEI